MKLVALQKLNGLKELNSYGKGKEKRRMAVYR